MIAGPIVIAILVVVIAAIADDFFTRNWDSIYDPRSKYQIWRDRRKKAMNASSNTINVPANDRANAIAWDKRVIEERDMDSIEVRLTKNRIALVPWAKNKQTSITLNLDKTVSLQLAAALTKLAEQMP